MSFTVKTHLGPLYLQKNLYYLDRFKDYYVLEDNDLIWAKPSEKPHMMIEDNVMSLKKISPNSVDT